MTDMYLTYQELRHLGVSQNLISMWKSRKCVDFHMLGGTLYVRYMSIPEQTRSKLALQNVEYVYNSREFYDLYNTIFIKMKYAYERDFIKYLNLYIELGVSNYKSTEYARKHAVWAYFIETYYSSPGIKHPVKEGCKAYNEIYPSRKISESRFRHLISEAQKEGISSIVIEKKKSGRPKIYDDTYKLMVCHFMRSGVAYSKAVIHRMVCEVCEERDMLKPSLRTVKNLCKEQIANTKVYSDRYGEDKMKNELLGYVSLEQAENVGDQFQIDGWTMPFWYYDRDKKKIKRLCFFSVLDAHSKKIVGWWIAKSENTETIMNGLECAIRGVGYYLPYEIVSDNHSFNQTAVSKNFKDTIAQLGCTWSVSSLPGRKLCLERGFRTLGENYAKTEYGYLGQGIKSRNKDARVSPELAEKYLKSGYILTEDQIKIIAVYMVKEWNNGSKIDGKSPNQLYEESARPNIIKLGEHHPAVYDMFNRNMDGKDIRVRRGQVNISRAGTLYEYMLNSKLVREWDGKKVSVKYTDLSEGVYLFNPDDKSPIGYVRLKEKAHSALANQTEKDAAIFGKVSSINKARKSNDIKEIAELYQIGDPELLVSLNAKTTPKDRVQEAREDHDTWAVLNQLGIDPDKVPNIRVMNTVPGLNYRDKEEQKKREQPFSIDLKPIDLNSLLEE